MSALLAEAVLEKEPGAKIIYDVRASWAVPETIERGGGVPLVNRVGHAYIKHRMREEDAFFGGEVSAHYYFRDFSQADSGVVPFLLMLELISKKGRKLSKILKSWLPPGWSSAEQISEDRERRRVWIARDRRTHTLLTLTGSAQGVHGLGPRGVGPVPLIHGREGKPGRTRRGAIALSWREGLGAH